MKHAVPWFMSRNFNVQLVTCFQVATRRCEMFSNDEVMSATCREQLAADRRRKDGHTWSASLMSYLDAGCNKTQIKHLYRL
jgi:hypothetical protein